MESIISLRVDNLQLLLKEHVQWFATLEEDSQLFRILFSSYIGALTMVYIS
jgi:hypothetical protein